MWSRDHGLGVKENPKVRENVLLHVVSYHGYCS